MSEDWVSTLRDAARQAIRPPFRDRRFWLVQALVAFIGTLHLTADAGLAVPTFGIPHFATVGLFLVPVVYAALTFGLGGSLATAAWLTVLSVPDLLFVDLPQDRLEDSIQLLIVDAVAIFVGHRVGREQLARLRVEEAQVRLRAYAAKVLQAQEEERRRIAHELHDDPLQSLIYLSRRLESVGAQDNAARGSILDESRRVIGQVAATLRETSQRLRPPSLDDLGLVPALRQLCTQVEERSGIHVGLLTNGQPIRLDPEVELGVFRIGQEALHNVERHAAARKASMCLRVAPDGLVLQIADDGVGFDAAYGGGGTLGIPGMQERAELLNGRVRVSSRPGKGTTVRLELPLEQGQSPATPSFAGRTPR
jgi:two-component system sensor histidine kinase DegS